MAYRSPPDFPTSGMTVASPYYSMPIHRSAPTLSTPSYMRGRGATDPLRGLQTWSTAGSPSLYPYGNAPDYRKPTTSSESKTYAARTSPAWRPPGETRGRHVPMDHRPPPPPPPKRPPRQDPLPDDPSNEMLAGELRKMAGILAKAQTQLHEERSVSAMRAEEAEAQLALAAELGRQEER